MYLPIWVLFPNRTIPKQNTLGRWIWWTPGLDFLYERELTVVRNGLDKRQTKIPECNSEGVTVIRRRSSNLATKRKPQKPHSKVLGYARKVSPRVLCTIDLNFRFTETLSLKCLELQNLLLLVSRPFVKRFTEPPQTWASHRTNTGPCSSDNKGCPVVRKDYYPIQFSVLGTHPPLVSLPEYWMWLVTWRPSATLLRAPLTGGSRHWAGKKYNRKLLD